MLALFCFFRPILLIDFKIGLGGLGLLELFAVASSYALLILAIFNLKKIKIDFVTLTIIVFCFYCLLSLMWGSTIKVVMQVVLPFIIFFSARIFIKNRNQLRLIVLIVIIAYIYPLFGSFYQILQGESVSKVEFLTGIERHSGLFGGIRPLANAMYFFSVFFFIKYFCLRPSNDILKYALILMLVISLYCAYKSYTRSILLALFILWSFGLFGIKNKYVIIFLVCGLIISFAFRTNLQEIFFKSTKEVEINVASSGRAYLWEHNIDLFKSYALYEKALGRGLGVGSVTVIGKEDEIWSSHNDYLHLLMQLGIIGLSLFLFIHWAIINEILSLRNKKKVKFFYIGFILSIIFVNFASGIITYQLPTAQLFWLVMGLFYHIALELNTEIEIK